MNEFDQLGITNTILDGLSDMGWETPFPIQKEAIPSILAHNDVIGQAHTGTGKTAAYAIPMLQNITPGKGIQGIILAPTRELAMQITAEIRKISKYTGTKTATIYGGQGMQIQLDAIRRGTEILVATPGRLIDHLKRGSVKLHKVRYVVLDEADVMLDMGFIDDIGFILDRTPEEKISSLFSATMPAQIMRLSEKYLNDPKKILIDSDDLSGEGIDQSFLVIKDREKSKYLFEFIEQNKTGQAIVFCSTKMRTRAVSKLLYNRKFSTVAIEGDMSQNRREAAMSRFRKGNADILVATDVAARGIDVPQVALVINYDVPNQDMVYFHRIGRTARAGASGKAITFVSYSSVGDWNIIKKQTQVKMTNLNEKLGIEVNIPDPLKRQVGRPQRIAYRPRTPFKRSNNRHQGNSRSGGGRYGNKRFGGRKSHTRSGNGSRNSFSSARSRW